MAAYNPSLSYQNEVLSTFPGDEKFVTYLDPPSSHPDNVNMYVNQASSAMSCSEILSVGSSVSPHNYVEIPFTGGKSEKMFFPSKNDSVIFPPIDGQYNTATGILISNPIAGDSQMLPRAQSRIVDGEQNFQRQGLSLSLGTQTTSSVSVPSFPYQCSNPSFCSFSRAHLPIPRKGTMSCQEDENEKNKELRTSEGLLSGFETESLCNGYRSLGHKEMHYNAYKYDHTSFANTILKSKYLKAAQQLLDEVINVQKVLKQPSSNKNQSCHGTHLDDSQEADERSSSQSMLSVRNGSLSNPNESVTNSSSELSHAERQDLQNRKTKLLSMLEEVDGRYKQYYHKMKIVASSLDMVAGRGAAKLYTALAHQTISHHFRSLHDAISDQIQVTRRTLGEQETSSNGQGGISRLRYVDHQLRQQRALQQLGVMRHAWRPQRGLPESSVSILRAWLFEHFLHPYPNDSEKIMLARQTGLTRNQVANWFINARVRLWKPMVEDMYKEEFGDRKENSTSCPENAQKACSETSSAPENRGEESQDKATASSVFQEDGHGENILNSRITRLLDGQRPNVNDPRLYDSIQHNQNGNHVLMGTIATYGISEWSVFAISNQVSLALGLSHHESDVFSGNDIGGNIAVASSVEHETVDYHCIDMGNQQDRFGNPHLLHDFVV